MAKHRLTGSPVFRDMISMAQFANQQNTIIFTDQWMECSRVVERVLDIVYTLEVGELDGHDTNTLLYVSDFAQKWDISMISNLMVKEIRMWIKVSYCPAFDLLQLALKLGRNELSAEVMSAGSKQTWLANHDHKDESQRASLDGPFVVLLPPNYQSETISPDNVSNPYGGDMFDLGVMPHQCFLKLPPTVVWAMLRAQNMSDQDT